MQATQANGFDGNGEALAIVNQIVGVVDDILPGEPPFGDREIHVSLDDRAKAVPGVWWEKQDHDAEAYRIVLSNRADAWYMVIFEGFCRTMPLSPTNSRGVRKESRLWQDMAFQLSHELAHVKLGPARSNLQLEVLATAVSLEALSRLERMWKEQPPRITQGYFRAKQSFRKYHELLITSAHEELPRSEDFKVPGQADLQREKLLHHSRRHVDQLRLWHPRSRAWQMIAADCLLGELRTNDQQWGELIGLGLHTYPSAWDEKHYRDDLSLVSDVVPVWWPEWLK
ncbi:hypothetical protein [Bremerella alba]|uniref:Uncharacterized protein n=1 Tax=Bremerella alba TaxID=980252 RepID=A0A7V9A8V2_9BACT|nr:hypothetical protein [Bremerella alba]MBA2116807.1 hypothetical protein [Bremerella alba]